MFIKYRIKNVLQKAIDPVTNNPITYDLFIDNSAVIASIFVLDDKQVEKYQAIANQSKIDIQNITSKDVKIVLTKQSLNEANAPAQKHERQQKEKKKIPGVKQVIMISSGKGGVGKSTIAANIAIALSRLGKKIALLDLDIYGPSLPKLFNVYQHPTLENNMAIPHERFGIKLMSVGFFVEPDSALVWRGPMASKMLHQLASMTNWSKDGEVDFLIIDTPPGTGDIHLSLLEGYEVNKALIVSTPQSLAHFDVYKGVDMLKKFDINILGVVSNMSYFAVEGKRYFPFGKYEDKELEIILELPIDQSLNLNQFDYPENSEIRASFQNLAERIVKS